MKGRGKGFEGRRLGNGDKGGAAGSGVAGAASNTIMKPLAMFGGIRLRGVKRHGPWRVPFPSSRPGFPKVTVCEKGRSRNKEFNRLRPSRYLEPDDAACGKSRFVERVIEHEREASGFRRSLETSKVSLLLRYG